MQSPPRKIGPYEVEREIGRGGMGVVYLARDTRLDRAVAIKALPSDLLVDADRLARFEREARMLASLSHANIAGVHGMEEVDGARYLVMEYVDGEDLSERLRGGALPVDEALHIAKQIARAVEAAHAGGVMHRDLKPANVKVTLDGDVKVLDFGLAKALDEGAALSRLHESPTRVANSPTIPGVVLGTAGYMSPEQARGKSIDKRSDIWSFGCILYEMLTGKCPFPGELVTESLGATIYKEPDWELLPAGTPPNIQLLLHRCLQKDRSRRLQDIGDARVELDDTLSGTKQAWTEAVDEAPPGHRKQGATWIALALLPAVAALGFAIAYFRRAPPTAPMVHAFIPAPDNETFIPVGDMAGPVVVSPDGGTLAFTALGEDRTRRLWIRPLEAAQARALPGTEEATFPFWSPDGRSLGFFAQGRLKQVDVAGGAAITVCDAVNARGGTWSQNGVILFAPEFQDAIYRVLAAGGTATPVTTIDQARHTGHRWPFFLPDGEHFLYLAIHYEASKAEENAIFFASLDGREVHEVLRSDVNAAFGSGHLLFVRQGTLMAVPFDSRTGRAQGDPQALAANVAYSLGTWRAAFDCSREGLIAYHPGGMVGGEGGRVVWFDRAGKELKAVDLITSYGSLRPSPDGTRVAFIAGKSSSSVDLWVYDVARELPMRLSFLPGYETPPVWSPDGGSLAFGFVFRTAGDDPLGIYRIDTSGGTAELLHADIVAGQASAPPPDSGLTRSQPSDWSPDGRYLLFVLDADVWALPLEPPGEPVALLHTPHLESEARFSMDGRWIAYGSDESGIPEVYVAPFDPDPESDGGAARARRRWQISSGGGINPRWSPDGAELFYLTSDSMLTAVGFTAGGDRFEPGASRRLFQIPLGPGNNYEILPEGTVIATLAKEESSRPIAIILNFTSGLDK